MEYGNKIKRLVGDCAKAALAVLAAAVFVHPAHAEQPLKDVSKEISDLRSVITSAKLYRVRSGVSFRNGLDENDVLRMGCQFDVTNTDDIHSLIEVLSSGQLVQVPPDKEGYDARIVVRFYVGDSWRYALVMGPDYTNAQAQGELKIRDESSVTTTPVEAKSGFERDIRFWAAQHASLAPKNCNR